LGGGFFSGLKPAAHPEGQWQWAGNKLGGPGAEAQGWGVLLMSGLKPGPISGATAKARAEEEADSQRERNTNTKARARECKGKGNGKGKGKCKGQGKCQCGGPSPSLRSGVRMTARNKQRQRQGQERLQVSPLRRIGRPFGFGRADRSLFGLRGPGLKPFVGWGYFQRPEARCSSGKARAMGRK
jgi:hypothetical protein